MTLWAHPLGWQYGSTRDVFGQEMFGHGLPVKSASFASNLLATASGDA